MDMLVIGGGFFGMYLSERLAIGGHGVSLVERESGFMRRASYRNQARVHNGYHYPRSMLTAMRSKASFSRFVAEFGDCIDDSFDHYYMISNVLSKTSARQFENFCARLGLSCKAAPRSIRSLVDSRHVEDVFTVREFAFDAIKLKEVMLRRIQRAGVGFRLDRMIDSVERRGGKLVAGDFGRFDMVFNCTYSMINLVIRKSKLPPIPLKHQLTEIALVEVPGELGNVGVTVMDGPFFSLTPFPCEKNLHSLSHVRYTPRAEWDGEHFPDKIAGESAWKYMLRDAARYIPLLSGCKYRKSLWEVKTFSPASEGNDSRPILFRPDHGLPGFHQIVGGKMDNVYDIIDEIGRLGILHAKNGYFRFGGAVRGRDR